MITLKNVSKIYPNGTEGLKNVSLHIDKGEFVFVVGLSGSGKSTMIKLLTKEINPEEGDITINSIDTVNMKRSKIPYLRRNIGIVFQDFRLFPNKTVFENVAFAMRIIGESTKKINKVVPGLLKIVGLEDKMASFPKQLSGGEQQRVALARALANNPSIIIADEPTGNVDEKMSYEIIDLFKYINEHGKTVIVVTHDMNLVQHYGKRVITVENGKIESDVPEVRGY